MTRRTAAFAVLLLAPAIAFAGKVKTYTASSPAQFDKAQFQHAVISNEGTVRLSRVLKPLPAAIDATRIWDMAEDKAGNLFVATGDEGKIFKITPAGAVSVAYSGSDSQVLSLLATSDGSVYAGTGPNGHIVRIEPGGPAKLWCETKEGYVWSLAFSEKDQAVFAATGPHGRILRVDRGGKPLTFFQSRQDHILSLVRADDGILYAGTDKQGLVYRIDDAGKGFVLFQAAQAEVRCLQLAGNALYAGTSSPGSRPYGSSSASSSGGGVSKADHPETEVARAAEDGKITLAPSTRDKERETEKPTTAPPPPSPNGGENSVYRIGFDGAVREIYRDKGLVLGLLKLNDRLFIGTGSKGQLLEINEATRERSEIARMDHGQIQRLIPRRDGSILVAASDPARIYMLHEQFANAGTVRSEVIDAKLAARWGAIAWQADLPKGTKLSIATRSGNVAEPDDTWSDWSAELTDAQNASVSSPAARYLQYRVSLSTSDPAASPVLHHLSIRHATLNQAPEVTKLEVPNLDAADVKEPKRLKFKWAASDANEDELVFDLFVRKDGWNDWVRIEEGWAKSEYEWDTTTMPSGNYRFKVVASDRPDNNEESALTGERIGGPFVVANEAPTTAIKLVGVEKGRAMFEATASSPLVRLTAASFALDGGKWANVNPRDGLFDSKAKSFRFQSELLPAGTHVLMFRVKDSAGNIGTADLVFPVKRDEK